MSRDLRAVRVLELGSSSSSNTASIQRDVSNVTSLTSLASSEISGQKSTRSEHGRLSFSMLRSNPLWAAGAPVMLPENSLCNGENGGDSLRGSVDLRVSNDGFSFGDKDGIWSNPAQSTLELQELLVADIPGISTVREFFENFYSDASDFSAVYHEMRQDSRFSCSAWSPLPDILGPGLDGAGIGWRKLGHHAPVRAVVGPRLTRLEEIQCCFYQPLPDNSGEARFAESDDGTNLTLVIQTVGSMSDVPYGDCFQVEMLHEAAPVETRKGEFAIRLRISLGVFFHKTTLFAPKIRNDCWKEALESFQLWVKLAQERVVPTPVRPTSLNGGSLPGNGRMRASPSTELQDLSTSNESQVSKASTESQMSQHIHEERPAVDATIGSRSSGMQDDQRLHGPVRLSYSPRQASGQIGFTAASRLRTGHGGNAWQEFLRSVFVVIRSYILTHQAFVMAFVVLFMCVLGLYVRVMALSFRVQQLETRTNHFVGITGVVDGPVLDEL